VTERQASAPSAWGESFTITPSDIEFINNLLLEEGVPLSSEAMAQALVQERLRQEARRRANLTASQKIYQPKNRYQANDDLVFPAMGLARGKVIGVRPGHNPDLGGFEVIRVRMDESDREFAANLAIHKLNDIPLETISGTEDLNAEEVMGRWGSGVTETIEQDLEKQEEFVRIAGRWFPRSLVVPISPGHLNLAEAVLDVAGGGPLPTQALLEHIDMPKGINPRLASFSLEYALQEDERFDEVGPSGVVMWFLKRLEPDGVRNPPALLNYRPIAYAPSQLPERFQELEREIEDEWGSASPPEQDEEQVTLTLTFPHWKVGTLPLTPRLARLFPTAYQAPRIRFEFTDAQTQRLFPGWVVRPHRYVFGLADWIVEKGLLPGAYVRVRQGQQSGQVVLEAATRRPTREWIRTASVDGDGRLKFTMQKLSVGFEYDELMVLAIANLADVDRAIARYAHEKDWLPRLVVEVFRELAKLNPQSTVHSRTLYSAVNVVRRLPPGPLMAELASRPYFDHVGDLYYRFEESRWVEAR
jgi:hypothetical protein